MTPQYTKKFHGKECYIFEVIKFIKNVRGGKRGQQA